MQRLCECVTHSCKGVCVFVWEGIRKSALLNFVWSTGIPVKPITPLRHLHAPRVLLGLTLRPSHTPQRVCITHHTFYLVLLLDLIIHYKFYTANLVGLNSSHYLRVKTTSQYLLGLNLRILHAPQDLFGPTFIPLHKIYFKRPLYLPKCVLVLILRNFHAPQYLIGLNSIPLYMVNLVLLEDLFTYRNFYLFLL